MAFTTAEVGKRALQEVELINFSELLQELNSKSRTSTTSNGRLFGIRSLDDLIDPQDDTSDLPTRPPVLEIVSEHPLEPVTALLYQAVSHAVLSYSCGGKSGAAVLIDTTGSFDILQLAETIRNRLHEKAISPEYDHDRSVDELLEYALTHVHVLRPPSPASTISTLSSLQDYLLDTTRHASTTRPLELLVLEGLSTFFWNERAAQEEARYDADSAKRVGETQSDGFLLLTRTLKQFQDVFRCSIIAPAWGLSPMQSTRFTGKPGFTQLLPGSWSQLLTCRIHLERAQVRKFPIGHRIADAEADREKRDSVLHEQRIVVRVVEGGGGTDRDIHLQMNSENIKAI